MLRRYDPEVFFWLTVVFVPLLWLLTAVLYLFVRQTSVRHYEAHGVSERVALATFFGTAAATVAGLVWLTGIPEEATPPVVMAVVLVHGIPIIATVALFNVGLLGRLVAASAALRDKTVLQSGTVRAGAETLERPDTEEPVVFYDADLAIRDPATGRESVPFLLDLGDDVVDVDVGDCGLLLFDRRYGTGAFAFPRGIASLEPGDEVTLLGSLRSEASRDATHAVETDSFALLTDLDPRAFRAKQVRRIGANLAGLLVLLVLSLILLSV